jgi:hypothetical protein
MEIDAGGDIDISDTVAVGEAKGVVVPQIMDRPFHAAARHCFVAGIDQADAPVFCRIAVDLYFTGPHVYRQIGHVKAVVGEIFLDHVSFVAKAYHEVVHAEL